VEAKPVVQNTRTMGRVPPAWEMGVEYNDRKDNKICLNVACKEAVTMFGHITELVAKVQPKDDSDLSKQYDDLYRLAVGLIEKLASLPIEEPEEEMDDEEQPA
jgi:phosphate uptake regulator